jgi:23S rRNA pseudouridine2605 synthase
MRLDRLLVERGFGSRKQAADAVRRGAVVVSGERLRDPSVQVAEHAEVSVHGEPVLRPPVLVAWHKPVGVLSTVRDPWGREGLEGALPPRWAALLHPVGRLDLDTSGLLLFSSDGALTQHLLHPRRAVPRTYLATVEVDPPATLTAQLAAGVETSAGVVRAEVEQVDGRVVRLTVREGQHRIVRRILHNAGASVIALHRVRYGAVQLDDLAEREVRVVSDELVQRMREGAYD